MFPVTARTVSLYVNPVLASTVSAPEKMAILSSAAFDIDEIGEETIAEPPPDESKNPLEVIGDEKVLIPPIL
jgi:hypothetical protein